MGEGDPKLTMMIGAFLGWRGALFAFVAAAFQSVIAYALARASGRELRPSASGGEEKSAEPAKVGDAKAEKAGEAAKVVKAAETEPTTDPGDEEAGASATPPNKREEEGERSEDEDDEDEDELPAGNYLPLGPFLALGALEFLFFGDALLDWYLRQFE